MQAHTTWELVTQDVAYQKFILGPQIQVIKIQRQMISIIMWVLGVSHRDAC